MFLGILLRAEGKRTPGAEKMPEAAWEAQRGMVGLLSGACFVLSG